MKTVAVVLFSALALTAWAQAPAQDKVDPAKSAQADPSDVKSLDAIVHALYDVISGPPEQARNWDRMRSLFHPQGRLIPTGKRPTDAKTGARFLTVEDYIQSAEPFFKKNGFFEREIARRSEQFGNIAHVFSTYESRHAKGEQPFQRGINSLQLFNDGTRWWILNVVWDAETPDKPIPPEYLK